MIERLTISQFCKLAGISFHDCMEALKSGVLERGALSADLAAELAGLKGSSAPTITPDAAIPPATPSARGDQPGPKSAGLMTWANMTASERLEFGNSQKCFEAYQRAVSNGHIRLKSDANPRPSATVTQARTANQAAGKSAPWDQLSSAEKAQYFGKKAVYEAFLRAQARGQVRIR